MRSEPITLGGAGQATALEAESFTRRGMKGG